MYRTYDLEDLPNGQAYAEEHLCPRHHTELFLGTCDECETEAAAAEADEELAEDEPRPRWICAKATVIRSARAGYMPISSYDGDRAWQGRVWISRPVFAGAA